MLNQLLALWASKEPERCQQYPQFGYKVFCWNCWHSWNPDSPIPWKFPVIEYALREAILARGWKWDLMNSDGIQAIIWTQQGDFHYNGTDYSDGREEQPAMALLMAYLRALGREVEA